MSATYADFVEEVGGLLAGIAPTVRGSAKAEHTAPPRYAWLYQGVGPAPTTRSSKPSHEIALEDDLHRVIVEIWGASEDDADVMRRALITAVRITLRGRRYTLADSPALEPEADHDGFKLAVNMTVQLPCIAIALPPRTPAAPVGSSPSTTARDAAYPVAMPTDVGSDGTAAPTAGDGILEEAES